MPAKATPHRGNPAFLWRLYKASEKVLFAVSRKREIHGMRVAVCTIFKEDANVACSKVETALNLISRYAPHRFGNLRRHVKWIWLFETRPAVAEWKDDLKACALSLDYVLLKEVTPSRVACMIMHESTHARLEHWGVGYAENFRLRIERLCTRTEFWLAKRLPDAERELQETTAELEAFDAFGDEDSPWTDQAMVDRYLKALEELAKESWIARLLARRIGRKIAERRANSETN